MVRNNFSKVVFKIFFILLLALIIFSGQTTAAQKVAAGKKGDAARVNINTAGLKELSSLPGVGASLAGRIIKYRTEKGPFQSVEELTMVKGVGKKKLEKMKPGIFIK